MWDGAKPASPAPHVKTFAHCLLATEVSLLQRLPCGVCVCGGVGNLLAGNSSMAPHWSWNMVQTPSGALAALPTHSVRNYCPLIGSSRVSSLLLQGFTHCCSLCPECPSHSLSS